jgi:hypothetical protein
MECLRTPYVVSPNPLASMAWTLPVRVDVSVLSPGNVITNATVCPSHRRPSGHHLSICPSVIVRVTTLPPTIQPGLVGSEGKGGELPLI